MGFRPFLLDQSLKLFYSFFNSFLFLFDLTRKKECVKVVENEMKHYESIPDNLEGKTLFIRKNGLETGLKWWKNKKASLADTLVKRFLRDGGIKKIRYKTPKNYEYEFLSEEVLQQL